MKEEESIENLLPVGIDLGSVYARVAIIQKEKNNQPCIIANPQTGLRSTLTLATLENNSTEDSANSSENNNGSSNHYIFGNIAHHHLSRLKSNNNSSSSSFEEVYKPFLVRQQSSIISQKSEEENSESTKASIAFFQYISKMAYESYNNSTSSSDSSPSQLRIVLSIPSFFSEEQTESLVNCCQSGIEQYIQEKEGKQKRRKAQKAGIPLVSGVLHDSTAVCIAHNLCSSNDNTWNNALVMNWGNTGFTTTVYQNLRGVLSQPADNAYLHYPKLSTKYIFQQVSNFIIMDFIRKNRMSLSTQSQITGNKKSMHKLHQTIEENTLQSLVRMNTVTIHIDSFFEGMDLHVVLSRARFESLIDPLLQNIQKILAYVKNQHEIDTVLCAGSVFSMPKVNSIVTSIFPNGIFAGNVECDEKVALGCALWANIKNQKFENNVKFDIEAPNYLILELAFLKSSQNEILQVGETDNTTFSVDEVEQIVKISEYGLVLPTYGLETFVDFSVMKKYSSCYLVQNLPDEKKPLLKITITENMIDEKNRLVISVDATLEKQITLTIQNSGTTITL